MGRPAGSIKIILVPTDFTTDADRAVDFAVAIALRFKARILLVNVIEPITYGVSDAVRVEDHYRSAQSVIAPRLNRLQQRLSRQGVRARVAVAKGTAYVEIVKQARRIGADLIVMGTQGRTGVRHLLLGSVAERVLRLAPCPVLTVRSSRKTKQ